MLFSALSLAALALLRAEASARTLLCLLQAVDGNSHQYSAAQRQPSAQLGHHHSDWYQIELLADMHPFIVPVLASDWPEIGWLDTKSSLGNMVKRQRVAAPSGDAYEDPMERIKAFQARMFSMKYVKPSASGSGAGRPADEVPMVQWKRSKATKNSTGFRSVDSTDAIPTIGMKAKSSKEKKKKPSATVSAAKSKVVQVPGAPIVATNGKSKISTPATSTLKVVKKKAAVTAKAPISKPVAPVMRVPAPVAPYVEIGEDPLKLAMQSVQAKMQALEKKKQNSRFGKPLPKTTKKVFVQKKKKKLAAPVVIVPEISDAMQENDIGKVDLKELNEAKPKTAQVPTANVPLTGRKHALDQSEQQVDGESKRKKKMKKKAENTGSDSIGTDQPVAVDSEGSSAPVAIESKVTPTTSISADNALNDPAAKSTGAVLSGDITSTASILSKNVCKGNKKKRARARKLSVSLIVEAAASTAVAPVQSEVRLDAEASQPAEPDELKPKVADLNILEQHESAQVKKAKQAANQSAKSGPVILKSVTGVQTRAKQTAASPNPATVVASKPKEKVASNESGDEESSDEEHDGDGSDFSQYQNQIFSGLIDQAARDEWELLEVGRLVRLFAAEWQHNKKKTARFLRRFCPELVSVDFMEGLNINLTASQLLKILKRGSGNPSVLASKISNALENGHLSVRDAAFLSFTRKKMTSLPTNEDTLEFLLPLLESLSNVRDVGHLLQHVCENWHIERTKALVQQVLLTPIFDDLDGNQDEIMADMPYLEGQLDFPSRMDQEDADENGNLIGFCANEDSDLGEEDVVSELEDAEEALGEIQSEVDEDDNGEDNEGDDDGEGAYEGETDSEEEMHLHHKRRPLRKSHFVLDEAEEGDEDEEEDESEEEIDDDDSQDSSDSDDSDGGRVLRRHSSTKTRKVLRKRSR